MLLAASPDCRNRIAQSADLRRKQMNTDRYLNRVLHAHSDTLAGYDLVCLMTISERMNVCSIRLRECSREALSWHRFLDIDDRKPPSHHYKVGLRTIVRDPIHSSAPVFR